MQYVLGQSGVRRAPLGWSRLSSGGSPTELPVVLRITGDRGAAAAIAACFLLIFRGQQGLAAAARRVLQAGA